jgi:ribosome maturation factor RimP
MLDRNLQQLLLPIVTALGYELVGVERLLHGGRTSIVRVYIENSQGISLQDCERVSYQISGLLDVENPIHGQYTLEVSSPGLARPLFTLEHFARFLEHKVNIRLAHPVESRRNFVGILQRIEEQNVVISVNGTEYAFSYAQINKAHLVPEETYFS